MSDTVKTVTVLLTGNRTFAPQDADGRSLPAWKKGDKVPMSEAQAKRFVENDYGKIVDGEPDKEHMPKVSKKPEAEKPAKEKQDSTPVDTDKSVENFELPQISKGAKKLIVENKLTDKEIAEIVPTGKNGIIAGDVEKYIESKE